MQEVHNVWKAGNQISALALGHHQFSYCSAWDIEIIPLVPDEGDVKDIATCLCCQKKSLPRSWTPTAMTYARNARALSNGERTRENIHEPLKRA